MIKTEIYDFGSDFSGLLYEGHQSRDKTRGDALNDHTLRYEYDMTPQEIFKAKHTKTYLVERKVVHPADFDVEWLEATEDEPDARPVTLLLFDGKLRTIEEWRKELEEHRRDECPRCNVYGIPHEGQCDLDEEQFKVERKELA